MNAGRSLATIPRIPYGAGCREPRTRWSERFEPSVPRKILVFSRPPFFACAAGMTGSSRRGRAVRIPFAPPASREFDVRGSAMPALATLPGWVSAKTEELVVVGLHPWSNQRLAVKHPGGSRMLECRMLCGGCAVVGIPSATRAVTAIQLTLGRNRRPAPTRPGRNSRDEQCRGHWRCTSCAGERRL